MSFGLDELQQILTDWPHVTKIPDAVGDGFWTEFAKFSEQLRITEHA
jgi:hypothetical protein